MKKILISLAALATFTLTATAQSHEFQIIKKSKFQVDFDNQNVTDTIYTNVPSTRTFVYDIGGNRFKILGGTTKEEFRILNTQKQADGTFAFQCSDVHRSSMMLLVVVGKSVVSVAYPRLSMMDVFNVKKK